MEFSEAAAFQPPAPPPYNKLPFGPFVSDPTLAAVRVDVQRPHVFRPSLVEMERLLVNADDTQADVAAKENNAQTADANIVFPRASTAAYHGGPRDFVTGIGLSPHDTVFDLPPVQPAAVIDPWEFNAYVRFLGLPQRLICDFSGFKKDDFGRQRG